MAVPNMEEMRNRVLMQSGFICDATSDIHRLVSFFIFKDTGLFDSLSVHITRVCHCRARARPLIFRQMSLAFLVGFDGEFHDPSVAWVWFS